MKEVSPGDIIWAMGIRADNENWQAVGTWN